MPDQNLIRNLQLVDGFDVPVGDDQDVRVGDRVNISKGRHLIIAVDYGGGGFTGENLAKNAGHKRFSTIRAQRSAPYAGEQTVS